MARLKLSRAASFWLLASIFIVVYLAFSVPALIAGVAVTHYGLRDTTYVYGIVVMTLAAMTAVSVWRPQGPTPRPPPPQRLSSPLPRSRRPRVPLSPSRRPTPLH